MKRMFSVYKLLIPIFEDHFAPLIRTAFAFTAVFPFRKDSESLKA